MDTPKKILIVEDDALLLASLESQFQEAGYAVRTATNGKQGFDAFMEDEPGIVLSDILMPGIDGIEMLENIKKLAPASKTPFIMLTTSDDIGHVASAMDKGAFAYLLKSDNQIDAIVKAVEDKLAHS